MATIYDLEYPRRYNVYEFTDNKSELTSEMRIPFIVSLDAWTAFIQAITDEGNSVKWIRQE